MDLNPSSTAVIAVHMQKTSSLLTVPWAASSPPRPTNAMSSA